MRPVVLGDERLERLAVIKWQKRYWDKEIEAAVKKGMDRQIEKEIEDAIRKRLEAAAKSVGG